MTAPRSLAIAIALVASTAILGILTSSVPADAQAQRPSTPVDIVSSVPLDVTGSVAIAPGASVTIGNSTQSPVPVRDVDEAAKEPFQHGTVTAAFSSSSSAVDVVTVPAGKRLVIEHFSAWINATGPDGLSSISLGIGNSGQFDHASCQQTGQTTNGLNHFFACSGPTRFYADAGETVRFFVNTTNSAGGFHRAFVSGYYVPVP